MQVKFMQRALELAQKAAKEDEVPIGAVIVDPSTDSIIAEAYNLSQHTLDATAHAEIEAIRQACRRLGPMPSIWSSTERRLRLPRSLR